MNITDIFGKAKMHNGVEIPYLGLGVFQAEDGREVKNAMQYAFSVGYRHIDTAAVYGNERGVGEAIAESGLDRKEVFLTTKLWNADQRAENQMAAFEKSLDRLGLDDVDLYLIHWPVAGKYKQSWKVIESIYKEGRARAIGVSNFMQHHLEDLMSEAEIVPMINQMEFHPHLVQQDLVDFCQQHHILYEAWSPLMQGRIIHVDLMNQLAEKYGKTPAQIVLRWNLQKGVVTIPKSVKPERIRSNTEVFDFELSDDDMAAIDSLDKGQRIGPDPDDFHF